MRGADILHESLFSISQLEDFIPKEHPLRPIRLMVNQALGQMNGVFQAMYAADHKGGRPSIAPEKLLRAMLLQILYSVRSERMLMEQIQYNMLFRWFVGLAIASKGSRVATPRTNPPPMPMHGCIAKATTPANCALWGTP